MGGKDKMRNLVFWLPNYPEVMESFFITLVKRNNFNVKIVCLEKVPQERKNIYDTSALQKYCHIRYWDAKQPLLAFFQAEIDGLQDEIQIFGGFLGNVGECLHHYKEHCNGKKAIILTEKPSVLPYRTPILNFVLRNCKKLRMAYVYARAYRKNQDAIAAVLVTGRKGVTQLKSYGVAEDRLFNFMYSHIDQELPEKRRMDSDKVRFVYVGRFNYCNRGLDNLMYVCDRLQKDNWTLDLVGGYGENAQEIIRWAADRKNVRYLGAWKADEVIGNMQDYDISVNPTKVDGWRIQVNQAIIAGIATITTAEAVSDELVKAADCGLVVNAFRKKELLQSMNKVLENPEIIDVWKTNAEKFAPRISNEAVSQYFQEILEYIDNPSDEKEKPVCPW